MPTAGRPELPELPAVTGKVLRFPVKPAKRPGLTISIGPIRVTRGDQD